MLVVGLTGGIAAGKSTVSTTLREKYKLTVVDADVIAKEVVDPGRKAYKQIVETFGPEIEGLVNPDDYSLNRALLGKAVFGNKEKLAQLNRIVHPAVKKEIIWQVLKAYVTFKSIVVLDVPLLYESGLYRVCGLVVTVSCERQVALERLVDRNPELSREDAEKRISSQMSNEERNYRADLVIDNNGVQLVLNTAIDSIVKEIRPLPFITFLDLFPLFGLLSALYTVALRSIRDKYKGTKPPKKSL